MSPAPMVSDDATLPVMATVQSPWAATVLAMVVSVLLVVTVVGLVVTPWQQSVPGQGRVIALFGVLTDVTEAFDTIRSIQDQNEMLDLAAQLAHLGH